MIIANVKPGPQDYLYLQFSTPDEVFKDNNFETFRGSFQDVKRMLYFRNRKYITQTLGSWLNQRRRAIQERPNQEHYHLKIEKATLLRDMVNNHSFSSLWSLCDYIVLKKEDINLIAPVETSKHYNYYCRTIIPIMEYCLQQTQLG